MVTAKEVQDSENLMLREIEEELRLLQSGISKFMPAAAGKGDAERQMVQAQGFLQTIQQEITAGKRFIGETVLPDPSRVSLNPELLNSVRLMFKNLHDLNNSNFKEDAGTLRVVFKQGAQTREKQLFSDVWKLHDTLRKNLPQDMQTFLQRAPQELRVAVGNITYKSPEGTARLSDALGWFQTQGDYLERWISALGPVLANPPPPVSKRFVEVLADPSKDAELKQVLARPDVDFKNMLQYAKQLRVTLRIYEQKYSQLNGVLELVFKLVDSYYRNPAEFAKLAGK
jgi:hypothetical protein